MNQSFTADDMNLHLVLSAWILTDEERDKGPRGVWQLFVMRGGEYPGVDLIEIAKDPERSLRMLVMHGRVEGTRKTWDPRHDPERPRHPWNWRRSSKHGVGRKARRGRKQRVPVAKAGGLV